jgi:hypothetical protein
MRYFRPTFFSLGLGFALSIVAACGKSEPPPAQQAAAPQPAAPATPPPAAPAPAAPAPAAPAFTVTAMELGNQIGADKRITQQITAFAPTDTIYLSVVTSGSTPSATLTAKWIYQDGQVVNESTQTITPTGPAATEFHISKPDGWPAGTYKVEVSLNGRSTGTKEFEVRG